MSSDTLLDALLMSLDKSFDILLILVDILSIHFIIIYKLSTIVNKNAIKKKYNLEYDLEYDFNCILFYNFFFYIWKDKFIRYFDRVTLSSSMSGR